MRSRVFQESAQEAYQREREIRDLQSDLEQCRIARDEWEHKALQAHVAGDETKTALELLRRDLEVEREARERELSELEVEREKANNLQSVLQDFQSCELSLSPASRLKLYSS